MSGLRTEALLLRALDFGESDRIVHLLTPERGRVAAIAKGARRSVRRFPGTLDIGNRLRVQLVVRRPGTLARLEQATLLTPFQGLRAQAPRFALACYLLEILDRAAPEAGTRRDAAPLYHFAIGVLTALEHSRPDVRARVLLELQVLDALGVRPELEVCVRCGRAIDAPTVGFHVGEGGPLCSGCLRVGEPVLSLHLGTLRALAQSLQMSATQRERLALPQRALAEAVLLVGHLRRFHLGFELRSERILDGILAGTASARA